MGSDHPSMKPPPIKADPSPEILDMDRVRELALSLGPILNGKDLGEVQATLVLSWLMTTGALNEIETMDERNARAGVFIQKGTTALGRLVEQVFAMTQGEVAAYLGTVGESRTRH